MYKLLLFLLLAGNVQAQVNGRGTDPYRSLEQEQAADAAESKSDYLAHRSKKERYADEADENRIALAKADARISAENRVIEAQAAQNRAALAAADTRNAQSQLDTPSAPMPNTNDSVTISKSSLLAGAGSIVGIGLLIGAFLLGKRRANFK